MKRFFILTLVLGMILCGCAKDAAEETAEAPTQDITQPTTVAAEESTEAPTEAAAQPVLPGNINPLTGETLEEERYDRPYAIMINNHKAALPHCGISQADVVYETRVEGGMTRFMAVFMDPSKAEAIGSVRSARPPFVGIAQAYDAIYCSASAAESVLNQIASSGVDYINALKYDGSYFYRDKARLNKGVAIEHTMFIKGEDLEALAEKNGLRTTRDENQTYGFHFDEAAAFDADPAETIVISFFENGKTTTCNYDEAAGAYTLYQQGLDYVDGNTNELVEFRNVLILEAQTETVNDGMHVQMENVGEGPGYYARDGKIIPITWSRETETSPYVYKTADGGELNMGIGTTYIAIITDGSPVEYK